MAKTHTVEQGECLSSIAKQYGFRNWHTVYDYGENADFRKKRPNPNVLFPGDVIKIPEVQEKKVSCPTAKLHTFVVVKRKRLLRLKLASSQDRMLANKAYTLVVGDHTYKGKTDGNGLLQHEISADATDAELTFDGYGLKIPLKIAHLDPVHDGNGENPIVSGAQARLNNLGFHCGEADGILGPKTQSALRTYQEEVLGRKDPDGNLDEDTRHALLKDHGC